MRLASGCTHREDQASVEGLLEKLEDPPAFVVVGQEGHPGEPEQVVRLARVRMLRTLDAGPREVVLNHDRSVALVAGKRAVLGAVIHRAAGRLVTRLLPVVLLALRALQEGLAPGHGFEAEPVKGVTAVTLKFKRHYLNPG